jgi:HSP20 family protein
MKLARFQRPELWSWPTFDDQLVNLRNEINRLFEFPSDEFSRGSEVFNTWAPALDLLEDIDHLFVRVELPGMKKNEIDLSLHQNVLTISGERSFDQTKEAEAVTRSERFFGKFQRSVTLPKPVDSSRVEARYQDGMLTVSLPKTEESKPKQIDVQAS